MSFELDILPIFTAQGCNAGACHGKSRGQNGFQLSLLAFDPDFDYAALTQNARGRRVFPAAPERSLLLQKGAALVPHGGGTRLPAQSPEYDLVRRWIAAGLPRRIEGEPTLVSVTVEPTELRLAPEEESRLTVTAHYSDGSTRNVTTLSSYQSNEAGVVAIDRTGRLRASPIPGEATLMARYMNLIATCHVVIPLPGTVPPETYASLPRQNFIDGLVWDKLQMLGITPSPAAGDAQFLRRTHLDIIGRLPSTAEARAFLADTQPEKRRRLVDALLERPEYADHWANKWADLLRPNPYHVGIKATLNYDAWIRDSFRANKPYDQFVRELVTARGSTWQNGAATMFRDRRTPDELTTLVSQLFLGVRLDCARCHHHPFEKWSQDDFYSFAAYFARVGRKGEGISAPISGGEEVILTAATGMVQHPLTGKVLTPRPLFGEAPELDDATDPRVPLANWIASDNNPFFAQVMANRVWADLMGRGLVEPIDDLRATNPPSNAPLLDALAEHFRKSRYNIKELIRTITTSHCYGLASLPTERNVADQRNYSRHYRIRLRAEVLHGAVCDVTGVRESFQALPSDSRADEIWTHRVNSLFLDTFGRPNENQDPPCERVSDTTVTQALHLLNAPRIHGALSGDSGRAAQMAAVEQPLEALIDEIYLLVYTRLPTEDERSVAREWFAREGMTRRQGTEDYLWALMNTPEFVFKD